MPSISEQGDEEPETLAPEPEPVAAGTEPEHEVDWGEVESESEPVAAPHERAPVPDVAQSEPLGKAAVGRRLSINRRALLAAAAIIAVVAIAFVITNGGDGSPSATSPPGSDNNTVENTTPTVATETSVPAPTAPLENSDRVLAFYYTPWETEEFDGSWYIWNDYGASPPDDICCDYYPTLGPYSTNDTTVLNQHFAWFTQAGIGIVGFDWWGAGSREDLQVPAVLDAAERYGLRVAFVINDYGGRTIENIVDSVEYIYEEYGDHPAFYRTLEESPHQGNHSKGLFLVWDAFAGSTGSAGIGDWASALEAIHQLPQGGIVLVEGAESTWVNQGGFDGLFNQPDPNNRDFGWATTLPNKAWYVPTVMPGFERQKHGTWHFPRNEGVLYSEWWDAALGTGVEPSLVALATFNDWRNGTQIEPAAAGRDNGEGFIYSDYGTLGEEGYLDLTAEHVVRLDNLQAEQPVPLRISIRSTSDHATALFAEGTWVRPTESSFVSAPGDHREVFFDGRLGVNVQQSIESAEAGDAVTMVLSIGLIPGQGDPSFSIAKGCIGVVDVEVSDDRVPLSEPFLTATAQPEDCDGPTTYTISLNDLGLGG